MIEFLFTVNEKVLIQFVIGFFFKTNAPQNHVNGTLININVGIDINFGINNLLHPV